MQRAKRSGDGFLSSPARFEERLFELAKRLLEQRAITQGESDISPTNFGTRYEWDS